MSGSTYAFDTQGAGADGRLDLFDHVLDRADDLRSDPDALRALREGAQVLVLDGDGNALAGADLQPRPVTRVDTAALTDDACFLGRDGDGRGWFVRIAEPGADDGAPRIDLRGAAANWPTRHAAAFACARALQAWHARVRFCGMCGGAVMIERAGWLGRCTQCGREHYPRTDAAVIATVTDGTQLLLGRQATWPARRWSLIAGFMEPGESLEQTVAREVLEETGVRVTRARYRASQPWPFPGSLMIGFDAEALPGPASAHDELEDARWFSVDEVVAAQARDLQDDGKGIVLSPRLSIARWLIDEWIAARLQA